MKIYYLINSVLLIIVVAPFITKIVGRPIVKKVKDSFLKKGTLLSSGYWTFPVFFVSVFLSYVVMTGILRGDPVLNLLAVTLYMIFEGIHMWSRECVALDEYPDVLLGYQGVKIREDNKRRLVRFMLAWVAGSTLGVIVMSLIKWQSIPSTLNVEESGWFIFSIWPYIILSLVLLLMAIHYKPSWLSFFRLIVITSIPCIVVNQVLRIVNDENSFLWTMIFCIAYLLISGVLLIKPYYKMVTVSHYAKYCFSMFYVSIAMNAMNIVGFIYVVQNT